LQSNSNGLCGDPIHADTESLSILVGDGATIAFPQHAEWVAPFKHWWEKGFKSWRTRNKGDAELMFLRELGPPHYAITDARGHELSDRWKEALTIKAWAEDIWGRTR